MGKLKFPEVVITPEVRELISVRSIIKAHV